MASGGIDSLDYRSRTPNTVVCIICTNNAGAVNVYLTAVAGQHPCRCLALKSLQERRRLLCMVRLGSVNHPVVLTQTPLYRHGYRLPFKQGIHFSRAREG